MVFCYRSLNREQSQTHTVAFIQFCSKFLDLFKVIKIKNVLQILTSIDISFFLSFLDSLAPLPRLEWNGSILAHCHLWLTTTSATLGNFFFGIFSKDRVSPCLTHWSQTPDPKWSTHLSFPKCWDYVCKPPCSAYIFQFNKPKTKRQTNLSNRKSRHSFSPN